MSIHSSNASRREFLKGAATAVSLSLAPEIAQRAEAATGKKVASRPRVAVVFTEFRFRSHTYNILENFLEPYLFQGELVDPGVDVVSFYADQFPENDLARHVSHTRKIPLYDSIDKALCTGGRELAVDAVLLIGEHGDYPLNELGQKMYPRKQFFDQIVAMMKRSKRFVPVFNDKHLSYRWDWAKQMYDEARSLGIPMMAGSSVPLAERRPPLDLPANCEIDQAIAVHGGGMESYGFHGLELLQSFIESRRGGEVGVSRVQLAKGAVLADALKQGYWSQELIDAAMRAERQMEAKRQPYPGRENSHERRPTVNKASHGILVDYRDGLRAAVLQVGNSTNRWNFACRLKGERAVRSTALYNGPWGNRCLFKALSHAIQHLFKTRKPTYPVERTLLVSGILDAAMHSNKAGGKPIKTPHLNVQYTPLDFRRFRENGKSWQIITSATPQPRSFQPGDGRYINQ